MSLAYSCVAITDVDGATVRTWRTTGIVYLIGSYISIFPPTSLPPGWEISRTLWQRILRKSDLRFLGRDLDDIPFEAIMQCYPRRGGIRSTIRK
ncbi:MAG: hypothetical protein WBV69_09645, partial [Candidatus Sulfotelmatobacter sp.]